MSRYLHLWHRRTTLRQYMHQSASVPPEIKIKEQHSLVQNKEEIKSSIAGRPWFLHFINLCTNHEDPHHYAQFHTELGLSAPEPDHLPELGTVKVRVNINRFQMELPSWPLFQRALMWKTIRWRGISMASSAPLWIKVPSELQQIHISRGGGSLRIFFHAQSNTTSCAQ